MIFEMNLVDAVLNYTILGGTTAPASADVNTIWIKTPAEISDHVLSPVEPEGIKGRVWIMTGDAGSVSFNALQNNGIQLYPILAKQHDGSEWKSVPAQIWQDGKWQDWTIYLFAEGDPCADMTGGWSARACYKGYNEWGPVGGAAVPVVTENSRSLTITTDGGCGLYHTRKKIDLSQVDTIRMTGSMRSGWGNDSTGIYILDSLDDYYGVTYSARRVPAAENVEESGEFTVDVSALKDSYYVCLAVGAYDGTNQSKITMESVSLEV